MPDAERLKDLPDISNPEVASVLVQNHRAFLGYLSRRMNSRADAEDVLQNFALRALSRSDQLRTDNSGGLLAWLYSLLRSTLADHYRKESRQGRLKKAFAIEMSATQTMPESDDLREALCACLVDLLPVLRPDQADLIRRIDLDGDTRAAVASELDLAPGTFAVRLHRARQALKDALLASCMSCPKHGFDDCACHPDKDVRLAMIARS